MADKKTAVFGIYSTRDGVERATDAIMLPIISIRSFLNFRRK